MNVLRKVIRVGAAYYISLPKSFVSDLGVFRGSVAIVSREGSRIIVETDPTVVKKAWEVTQCKPV